MIYLCNGTFGSESIPLISHILDQLILINPARRDGSVVSMSNFHVVGGRFASWPGHTKDYHKNVLYLYT